MHIYYVLITHFYWHLVRYCCSFGRCWRTILSRGPDVNWHQTTRFHLSKLLASGATKSVGSPGRVGCNLWIHFHNCLTPQITHMPAIKRVEDWWIVRKGTSNYLVNHSDENEIVGKRILESNADLFNFAGLHTREHQGWLVLEIIVGWI